MGDNQHRLMCAAAALCARWLAAWADETVAEIAVEQRGFGGQSTEEQ
jgi:hypothetical protein